MQRFLQGAPRRYSPMRFPVQRAHLTPCSIQFSRSWVGASRSSRCLERCDGLEPPNVPAKLPHCVLYGRDDVPVSSYVDTLCAAPAAATCEPYMSTPVSEKRSSRRLRFHSPHRAALSSQWRSWRVLKSESAGGCRSLRVNLRMSAAEVAQQRSVRGWGWETRTGQWYTGRVPQSAGRKSRFTSILQPWTCRGRPGKRWSV